MTTNTSNKLLNFKYRFVTILNYLGSDKAVAAAKEIENLPNEALDGFHDAYLTSKIISITLTYMTKEEFKRFEPDAIRSHLLAALFGFSSIEEQVEESLDNIFIYCSKNPEESLDDSLANMLESVALDPFELYWDELFDLKIACDSFINFYEQNKTDIEIRLAQFPDTISIENTHKGPRAQDLQETTFLSDPEEKSILFNNGSLIINNLRPCLGILLSAENSHKELACSAYHHMPFYDYDKGETEFNALLSKISPLIKELADKDYSHHIRVFITGSNFTSFPLALRLIMHYWNENTINANIHLIPSPQGCWSYCLVKLRDNICRIKAGSEFYNNDRALCEERGIDFENSDLDTFDEETSDESNSFSSESSEDISSKQTKVRLRFFDSAIIDDNNEEQPLSKKRKCG